MNVRKRKGYQSSQDLYEVFVPREKGLKMMDWRRAVCLLKIEKCAIHPMAMDPQ